MVGNERKEILKLDGQCYQIAYDWIGDNLYWTTKIALMVLNLKNGTLPKTLITELIYPE